MVRIISEPKMMIMDDCHYDELISKNNYGTDTEEMIEETVLHENTVRPITERVTRIPRIIDSISRTFAKNRRTKPSYSDCWLIGDSDGIEEIERYRIPSGEVTIGTSDDGQIEYHLVPKEYRFDGVTNDIVHGMIERMRTSFLKGEDEPNRQNILSRARSGIMAHMDHLEKLCGGDLEYIDEMITDICETVYRHTMGLGIFEILLSDRRLEDIYIDAPCEKNRIHVTLNGISGFNSHVRCRTNLMVDRREVQNLISSLKRESGLSFCESSPVLETDVKDHDARATVVGYPMSPLGDAVALRKHSARPWTLTRLIQNGTIDAETAGLLSFLVDMRSTFLISGARGAGKSSLLSAMMFEFPLSQRILTIEDTMELPCEKMRRMGYKVQSMLLDDRMEGDALKRSDEALRVSLRMGESAIVLGEVRGEEAKTLYQSMRTGRAGSSIMGTIHGDSARSVYERVVHDMGIAPEAFMATDIIVTVGTKRERGDTKQVRKVSEIVATSDAPGTFVPVVLDDTLFDIPVMKRILASSSMDRDDILSEIRIRAGIREYLAQISDERNDHCGPEWISMSNVFVSKEIASGNDDPESIVNEFKQWFGRYNGFK